MIEVIDLIRDGYSKEGVAWCLVLGRLRWVCLGDGDTVQDGNGIYNGTDYLNAAQRWVR